MKKRIVLCADDYGQALAISQAIINLIRYGRLSATSCMVNTPCWFQQAKWLAPYQDQIDIGLHFNLTHLVPLSSEYKEKLGQHFFALPILLRKAFLNNLDQAAIEAECHAQIDHFQAAMGFLPHYLDGHQHVHQFPVIRKAILAVYEKRLRQENAYIRSIDEPIKIPDIFHFKRIIIKATGTKAFKKQLEKNKIPHNQSFTGIYPFEKSHRYEQFFPSFLSRIKDKGLILCHPGLASSEAQDPLARTRYHEYQYLSGSAFLADCRAFGVALERFKNM
jgi:predicted glycoside hydrolase/deacetylase ChbG (UPF0249 family)